MAKTHRLPQFVAVSKALLRDPAFRKLSSSAKIIYIYMRGKFNTSTFSEVSLSYSEVADFMSTATVSKAFKDLEAGGFIEKTKQGGLYGGVCTYKFLGPHKDFYYKGRKV